METLSQIVDGITNFLNIQLFTLGGSQVTVGGITYVIVVIVLLVWGSGRISRWIARVLLRFGDVDVGVRTAIATIIRYAIVAIGFMVLIQTAGVNLGALTVLAGAAGLGIGFGLQNIISNFVSGLVILFERPIKVGDRVEVGEVRGDVVEISARATTVVTNDNIAIIVPNSHFISETVTNWSYTDRKVRLNVPVGVSYSSDPELVTELLMTVAKEHAGVLVTPKPEVLFEEFGDSSLNFTLQVWTTNYSARPRLMRSEINYAIHAAFREHNVEIPFPQRDLHIRSGSIDVRQAPAGS